MGTDPDTGQPITTNEWIDRLAPKATAVDRRWHVRDIWRHSRDGRQSDRLQWASRIISGWNWRSQSGIANRERARLSRCSPTT